MDGYSRKVGARLRSLRKQRGLTLQQVEVLSNKRLKGSLLAAYGDGLAQNAQAAGYKVVRK